MQALTSRLGDAILRRGDIFAGRKSQDHPRGDGGIGQAIDDDKRTGRAVIIVGVEYDRPRERNADSPDFIETQPVSVATVQRVDVHAIPNGRDRAGGELREVLENVAAADSHRLLGHPDDHRVKLRVHVWPVFHVHEHVAATDVDLVFQNNRTRQRREQLGALAVGIEDRLDAISLPARQSQYFVAGTNHARRQGPHIPTECAVGAADVLHGESQVNQVAVGTDLDGFQKVHQRPALIPFHIVGAFDDIVALERTDGNVGHVGDFQLGQKRGELLADFAEDRLVIIDDVHLVDRDDEVADAQQRRDARVALRLDQHALCRVDENNHQVRGARTGGGIAGVLLVARGVGDDEFSTRGREVTVSDVDGNALLALGLQAIGHQRQVEVLAGRTCPLGIVLDRLKLILINALRLKQQPADQRALAIVDAASCHQTKEVFLLVVFE